MKKLIVLLLLLFFASVASANRILDWVFAQEYNKTQLSNVTRAAVLAKADEYELDAGQKRRLMGSYHALLNAAWSDWRERRIETARGVLEATVQEYDADAVVLYMGQEQSSTDPNSVVSIFTIEVDLELER